MEFYFYRSLKAEKERYEREMEFHLKLVELENQRRIQERDHELRMFSFFMGNNNMSHQVQPPQFHLNQTQIPEHFGGFPHNPIAYNTSTPINPSDTSSESSSSANTNEGLRSYYTL